MNNDSPLVSIGIPTFNRADTLEKCIDSVLQQTYSNIEIIISDNMSSDSTQTLCRKYERQDRRVTTYRQQDNIGEIPNFDYVRKKSIGTYFMLLGDDDWIDPELIQSCVQFLEENPDHIAAAGRTFYYRENGDKFEGVHFSIQSNDPGVRVIDAITQVVDGGAFYALYRASPANEIPYFKAWGCDYYFLCEAAYYGKMAMLPNVACHRIDNSHKQSISARLRSGGFDDRKGRDPYGTIASILFWRIAANGVVFNKLKKCERLQLAAQTVEIVNQRWTITGKADLLKIATELFDDLDLLLEYKSLRARIITEWLVASKRPSDSKWNQAASILDVFIKLGFSGHDANSEERDLLNNLMAPAATIDDVEFKNEAYKIITLFN